MKDAATLGPMNPHVRFWASWAFLWRSCFLATTKPILNQCFLSMREIQCLYVYAQLLPFSRLLIKVSVQVSESAIASIWVNLPDGREIMALHVQNAMLIKFKALLTNTNQVYFLNG